MSPNDLSLVIGLILPPLIEIVKQRRFADWVNALLVVLSCSLVALAQLYVQGTPILVASYMHALALIFVAAVGAYKLYWQPVLGDKLYDLTNVPIQLKRRQ